jgi:macrolide-specific efflux system membrane fusion protein
VARAHAREKLATSQIAEALLAKHEIKATVAGDVVEVAIEPGEWIEAGKPIVRVISLSPVRVECFIDGRKHGFELVGRTVEFIPSAAEESGGGKIGPLVGKVTFVSPELNAVTGQARLWATVDNPKHHVRAGMRGRLVIK